MYHPTLSAEQITAYAHHLSREEKSAATLAKYLYDIRMFAAWLGSRPVGLSSGKCDFMGTVHTAGNRDPAPAQSGARVSFLRWLFHSTSS